MSLVKYESKIYSTLHPCPETLSNIFSQKPTNLGWFSQFLMNNMRTRPLKITKNTLEPFRRVIHNYLVCFRARQQLQEAIKYPHKWLNINLVFPYPCIPLQISGLLGLRYIFMISTGMDTNLAPDGHGYTILTSHKTGLGIQVTQI
jgi:hypothetical protein